MHTAFSFEVLHTATLTPFPRAWSISLLTFSSVTNSINCLISKATWFQFWNFDNISRNHHLDIGRKGLQNKIDQCIELIPRRYKYFNNIRPKFSLINMSTWTGLQFFLDIRGTRKFSQLHIFECLRWERQNLSTDKAHLVMYITKYCT